MKLYWGSHTCAIGIHLLLEEVGAAYETERVDVAGGATRLPPFLAVNPKGKVPVLVRDDGSVLTEFAAIATWIARSHDPALIPDDPEGEARMAEALAYIEGTIHGQGFARMFAPHLFEPQDVAHQTLALGRSSVVTQGKGIAEVGFALLDAQLGRHEYLAGDRFTIADAALFYTERWAPTKGITLPFNVDRHYLLMLSRPAVRRARELEGEA